MGKRDTVKLRNIATELDELTGRFVEALRSMPSPHHTMVADGPKLTAVTLFANGAKAEDIHNTPTIMDFGKHVQEPAYAALAFRMATILLNEPDAAKRPPAFADMSPDVILELHFLQEFILMTYNQEIDMVAGVELSSDGSGLVTTLLLTTTTTNNTYRTKVAETSLALRSDIRLFKLFDSATYGSVMVMA